MGDYKLSQSTLGDFEDQKSCKRKVYFRSVKKEIPRDPPSNQMIKGIVFETLALGESVSSSELPDHGFLYTAKGAKSVELERIELQAEKYRSMVNPASKDYIGFQQKRTQLTLENDFMKGVLDIEGIDDFGDTVISDLKFTADVDNDRGDYAWGRDPNKIDWKQLVFYRRLYEDNYESTRPPRTSIIVFDASPRMGIKLFDIKLSDHYINSVIERASYLGGYIDRIQSGDIDIDLKVNPSKGNCDTCPLECSFRFKDQEIKTIKVYV